jgi:hypothetical protein
LNKFIELYSDSILQGERISVLKKTKKKAHGPVYIEFIYNEKYYNEKNIKKNITICNNIIKKYISINSLMMKNYISKTNELIKIFYPLFM